MNRDFHLQSLEKSCVHDVESSRHGEPASTAVVQLYGFRFFMLSVFISFRVYAKYSYYNVQLLYTVYSICIPVMSRRIAHGHGGHRSGAEASLNTDLVAPPTFCKRLGGCIASQIQSERLRRRRRRRRFSKAIAWHVSSPATPQLSAQLAPPA